MDDKYIEKISAEDFFQSMDLENALEKFDFYKEPSEVHDFSQEGKDLGEFHSKIIVLIAGQESMIMLIAFYRKVEILI